MLTRMEQKLEKLKVNLDAKFEVQKESISELTKEICHSMFRNFEKILNEELRKQNEKIENLEAEKQMLKNHVMELKRSNLNMQQNLEDVEQYGRRRIDGVTVKNNESVDLILEDVKAMFEQSGNDVSDGAVDRAHQIGQGFPDSKFKQKCKSIIICFTTFRH